MHRTTTRLLATAIAILLVVLSAARPLDRLSTDYVDTALRNALTTFAVARVLNAGISVVQSTNVSLSPAGIGVTVSPGEVLDPLNDLIERFSWVMLAAATSLGIQKLLIEIGAAGGFTIALAAALAFYLLALWYPRLGGRVLRAAFTAAAVLVALRFSMSVVLLANDMVYRHFMEEEYLQAQAGLDGSRERIEALGLERQAAAAADARAGLGDRLLELWEGASERFNPIRHLDALKAAASEAIDHVIRLIVIFVLQTILLPLLFLWLLYKLVGTLLAPALRPGSPGAAASEPS